MNNTGAKRLLTRENAAFVLELRSEGLQWCYIAHYVYGITDDMLRSRMRSWGAIK
jgi:hypothetical protein